MAINSFPTNPLAGTELRTRSDVANALQCTIAPLLPYFSASGARVALAPTGAVFDCAAVELEGYARPLWGLAPFAAGGGQFDHWALYRRGLVNGTDPHHPHFWGTVGAVDQRMVELAAIGFALLLVAEHLWNPLSKAEKEQVLRYLQRARSLDYSNNNWKFFRIILDLGLAGIGHGVADTLSAQYLAEIDDFHVADGWYRDGPTQQMDHYIPFAMHYYGLIYVRYGTDEAQRERFRNRARQFCAQVRHWYADDGAALPFGRSLTYRFACAGIWGALAFANLEALPWGVIKGYYLRHLRWWSRQRITDRDGVLAIGYAYPNLLMSENYNSACSPYWACKAFLPLALSADHPFWQADEVDAPVSDETPHALPVPGMVLVASAGNTVALSCGQQNRQVRFGAEKYAKFAYASRYGFSIESDERNFDSWSVDNMLALSEDGRHGRVREENETARIAGCLLFARWKPWPDVTVETWMLPSGPWHVRVHRITSARGLHTIEGGFALGRINDDIPRTGPGWICTGEDFSAIVDLSAGPGRSSRIQRGAPNAHIMAPRAWIPQLCGRIEAGVSLLVTAVVAVPDPARAASLWAAPPTAPDLAALIRAIECHGVIVGALLPFSEQARHD
jgi:hypothetical protein